MKETKVCPTCCAIVYDDYMSEHLDWHNRIEMKEYL